MVVAAAKISLQPADQYQPITAIDLYAITQGYRNTGDQLCYWCGSACDKSRPFHHPPHLTGVKYVTTAKRPGNCYTCNGCWLWGRERITVTQLGKDAKGKHTFHDGHVPTHHSWWMTSDGAWIVQKEDYPALYECLLKPPLRFTLALLSKPRILPDNSVIRRTKPKLLIPSTLNSLHLAHCNDLVTIDGATTLYYTLDNKEYCYTTYELERALLNGGNGISSGTRFLLDFLGVPEKLPYGLKELPQTKERTPTKSGGRPVALPEAKDTIKKLVAASGR